MPSTLHIPPAWFIATAMAAVFVIVYPLIVGLLANGIRLSTDSFPSFPSGLRARPLTSLEVVLELISQTTTKEGLTVMALIESHTYPTGKNVSDEEGAALHLLRDPFHDEWNAPILPPSSLPAAQLM